MLDVYTAQRGPRFLLTQFAIIDTFELVSPAVLKLHALQKHALTCLGSVVYSAPESKYATLTIQLAVEFYVLFRSLFPYCKQKTPGLSILGSF